MTVLITPNFEFIGSHIPARFSHIIYKILSGYHYGTCCIIGVVEITYFFYRNMDFGKLSILQIFFDTCVPYKFLGGLAHVYYITAAVRARITGQSK